VPREGMALGNGRCDYWNQSRRPIVLVGGRAGLPLARGSRRDGALRSVNQKSVEPDLSREVHKFISICDDIHRLNPTGRTVEDRMAMAIRRYG
jgi:hypothetical protein